MCAGSIQTALSQYIASHMSKGKLIFRTGLGISMSMSFALAFFICRNSDFLAAHVLMEPRCAPYLPVMGISVPFAAQMCIRDRGSSGSCGSAGYLRRAVRVALGLYTAASAGAVACIDTDHLSIAVSAAAVEDVYKRQT